MSVVADEHMEMLRKQKDWDKLSLKQKFDIIQGDKGPQASNVAKTS